MQGLSVRNLKYMRELAEAWPNESIVQQAVGTNSVGHNVRLSDLVKTPEERLWYAQADYPERLEPECPRDADRGRSLPPAREGDHEFSGDPSAKTLTISIS